MSQNIVRRHLSSHLANDEIVLNKLVDVKSTNDISNLLADKRVFYLNQWLSDFPDTKVSNYSELDFILSRSKAAQNWFQFAKEEYNQYSIMPQWILNSANIRAQWRDTYVNDNVKIKTMLKKFNEEKSRIAQEYHDKTRKINLEYKDFLKQFEKTNPLVLIERITVEALPIEMYEETLSMNEEQAKSKLSEILYNYKQSLAVKLSNGEITIDHLIELLNRE